MEQVPTRQTLIDRFRHGRRRTEAVAALLSAEDQQVQSMPDASPTKWHRAHTTWFYEQFLLGPAGIPPRHEGFSYLFNSYYDGVGERHPRASRGLLTRPDAATIAAWRRDVDDAVVSLLERVDDVTLQTMAPIVRLGLAHEEQHQELIVTDALHLLSQHPWRPALQGPSSSSPSSSSSSSPTWLDHEGGVVTIGRTLSPDDLVFDNEGPTHRVFLEPFALSTSLVTVAALRAFIDAGGYTTPSLWLAAGFDHVRASGRRAPLYVRRRDDDGALLGFTVHGEQVLPDEAPVTHLSLYEADALARFLDARLPTEAEWEHAASRAVDQATIDGAGFDVDDTGAPTSLLPRSSSPAAAAASSPAAAAASSSDFFGVTWQWTQSAYQAFPGYRPAAGVVGEYNGKFMIGQSVLRGSSSYTPRGHSRTTYRNFWPAPTSFQNAGLRLARDRR